VCLCYLGNWPFVLLSPLLLLLDTLLRRHSGTGIVSRTNRNRLQNLKQIKLPFKFTILDRSRLTLTAKFLSGTRLLAIGFIIVTCHCYKIMNIWNFKHLFYSTKILWRSHKISKRSLKYFRRYQKQCENNARISLTFK